MSMKGKNKYMCHKHIYTGHCFEKGCTTEA